MAVQLDSEIDFQLQLENFEGPFDLLLRLIGKHELDITTVSLARVTDDFIQYVKQLDEQAGIESASEFLVVAATLLELKIASLLPQGEVVDAEDIALLEARDLLFAKLLQYRAFKEIAATFAAQIEAADKSFARVVALDPALSALLPEVLIGVGPARFAAIAERCLTPKSPPVVGVQHLYSSLVSVAEESKRVVEALKAGRTLSFRNLISDADSTLVVVARFLALLDLYRQGVLRFNQVIAMGELQISWTGSDSGEIEATDEFDLPVISTEEEENV